MKKLYYCDQKPPMKRIFKSNYYTFGLKLARTTRFTLAATTSCTVWLSSTPSSCLWFFCTYCVCVDWWQTNTTNERRLEFQSQTMIWFYLPRWQSGGFDDISAPNSNSRFNDKCAASFVCEFMCCGWNIHAFTICKQFNSNFYFSFHFCFYCCLVDSFISFINFNR